MRRSRSGLNASIVAALAIAAAGPVLAEPAKTPPDTTAKPAGATKPKEEPVCRNEEVTGSLVRKRVCFTQKQMEAQRQATEDLNKERQESGGEHYSTLGLTPSGTLH